MKRQPTTATSGERLQKILSHAGISSRRAAEAMIRAGRVAVNGLVVTELGTRADPRRDRITLDGRPLRAPEEPLYLLLNKPVGVMTTLVDPAGRPTVRDLLRGVRARVFPVGRLDFHSAGLLLLTNDGDLALRLTHPRFGVRKTYHVKVKGQPAGEQLESLRRGVRLEDGPTNPAIVHVIESGDRKAWLEITIAEGKTRQVRRMCEAVGLPVEKLTRVALGPLRLGKLVSGAWRTLTDEEVAKLRAATYAPSTARPRVPSRVGERHRDRPAPPSAGLPQESPRRRADATPAPRGAPNRQGRPRGHRSGAPTRAAAPTRGATRRRRPR